GMADVQVAVGLGRKAGVHASVVLAGLQVFDDDVADEISRTGCRIHNSFSLAMAWSIRRRQVSWPRTSRVPNSGGAVLRPHTATRTGSNIWPALMPRSPAAARNAASRPSCENSAV